MKLEVSIGQWVAIQYTYRDTGLPIHDTIQYIRSSCSVAGVSEAAILEEVTNEILMRYQDIARFCEITRGIKMAAFIKTTTLSYLH